MKLFTKEIKTIAIFRALQLGDVLCAMPAIATLRSALPAAHISFIGLPGIKELIDRYARYIDEFIPFPGYPGLPEQNFDPVAFHHFSTIMRQRQFDLLLQMQGNGTIVNGMLADLQPNYLAGFCPVEAEQTNLMLHYPNQGHEITRHLALMEHLGLGTVENTDIPFQINDDDLAAATALQHHLRQKQYVCIHPGSRGAWRQWPIAHFASIADFCASQGYQVVITGTASEVELAENIAQLTKCRPIIFSGKTNLGTLAVLINQCKVLVANCTGVSHLAAALKKQSVIISMDGEPTRWGAINKALHKTIDWTVNPNYQTVFNEVASLLAIA